MNPALPTLGIGLLIGYLGQRSRLCFISGYRDLLLMGDAHPLRGVLGTLLGAFVGYIVFRSFGGAVPNFPLGLHSESLSGIRLEPIPWTRILIGGLGTGFVGAIIGGCPFRMHVLAAEGKKTYWFYLFGFYAALVLSQAMPIHRLVAVLAK